MGNHTVYCSSSIITVFYYLHFVVAVSKKPAYICNVYSTPSMAVKPVPIVHTGCTPVYATVQYATA